MFHLWRQDLLLEEFEMDLKPGPRWLGIDHLYLGR